VNSSFLEVSNVEEFHLDIRGLSLEAVEEVVLEVEADLAVPVAVIDSHFLDEDTSLHIEEVSLLLPLDEEDLSIGGKGVVLQEVNRVVVLHEWDQVFILV
jgi:hypothetical protein